MSGSGKQSDGNSDVPLWQLLDSPTVDIVVGSEKTRWPLPERLLSHHSTLLASVFDASDEPRSSSEGKASRQNRKSYTLADEDNEIFRFLIEYLYSSKLPSPSSESSIGPLLDLYLLAQKLKMTNLEHVVVDSVRNYYHSSNSYPGLRRVQYIYANTDEDNEMREMMVSAVARQLTLGEKIPAHWATALQNNGQLAVDIIRAIQQWHIDERSIPDARDGSEGRGRKAKGGFSAVERESNSAGTNSIPADSAIGLESRDGNEDEPGKHAQSDNSTVEHNLTAMREAAAEGFLPSSELTAVTAAPPNARRWRPPARLHSTKKKKHRSRLGSAEGSFVQPSTIIEVNEDAECEPSMNHTMVERMLHLLWSSIDVMVLAILWSIYICAMLYHNVPTSFGGKAVQEEQR